MRRTTLLIAVLAAVGATATAWWSAHREPGIRDLVLYGNTDLRQVELPFNDNERIEAVLVQEGDRVKKGQVLARLETKRLEPQVAEAAAQAAAQRQVWERLRNGSRPEEIAQARANVEAARADAANARRQHERVKDVLEASNGAVSLQDLENAKATLDVADAKLVVAEKSLDLALLGPRVEEVAEAEARMRASEAQLAFLRRQLADTELVAPSDAVVRSRIMEPGEMASPQRPVLMLSIDDPKWVRAYVSETDLVRVHPGTAASVTVDGFPGRSFEGWVGFVSSVAEFTPKAVETEELRTSLVYEVRVFVKDPGDDLRLGMPATVRLHVLEGPSSGAAAAVVTTATPAGFGAERAQ
jgi:HlyD family secretion protein